MEETFHQILERDSQSLIFPLETITWIADPMAMSDERSSLLPRLRAFLRSLSLATEAFAIRFLSLCKLSTKRRGEDTLQRLSHTLPSLILILSCFCLFADLSLRSFGSLEEIPMEDYAILRELSRVSQVSCPEKQVTKGCFRIKLPSPDLLSSVTTAIDRFSRHIEKNEFQNAIDVTVNGGKVKRVRENLKHNLGAIQRIDEYLRDSEITFPSLPFETSKDV